MHTVMVAQNMVERGPQASFDVFFLSDSSNKIYFEIQLY
jgi:hypothetical protein